MIMLYIEEENIFVVIIYKLLVRKKYLSIILKTALELVANTESWYLKQGGYVKFKNYERKIKSPFIIYSDFESILVAKNHGKQNPKESYASRN